MGDGTHHHHNELSVLDKGSSSRLFLTVVLNFVITAAQVVGGLLSNSLALMSDALHNLSDGVAVLLAYIALKLGRKPRTAEQTYGFKRIEILTALFNSLVLIGISIYLVIQGLFIKYSG